MSRPNPVIKDTLLDAAETIAARDGVARLTFDAVAAEAGVSKGGVLHYFTTKDQLIEGMVKRTATRWRDYFKAAYDNEPEGPGRMTRGLLKSCFTDAQTWTEALRRAFGSVFAALAHNPALIEPMREAYTEFYHYVEQDGLPPGVAESVTTAMDGLWFYWVLRLRPVNQGDLDRMRGALELTLDDALKSVAQAAA
ncbi:TetR/AcrR family transcriptional regulator [Verrucomicrobium sp. BvORR034]|jgi:AcrR family transcriptional regulator|uniref:TetR/AcrR family transcriptional regulator n=1 Tax=Verrucomicrobium sp. BvORR034 TaxID=1396418 RepID=UPI000679188A|nr:TetR/AcrR family transcriptional regulator [Verrucomicrobium sp. BvORR034]